MGEKDHEKPSTESRIDSSTSKSWPTSIVAITGFLVALSAIIYNSNDLLKQSKEIFFPKSDLVGTVEKIDSKSEVEVWHAWIAFPYRNHDFCIDFMKEFFKEDGFRAEEYFPKIDTITYSNQILKIDARCLAEDYLGSSYLLLVSASSGLDNLAAIHKRARAKFAMTDSVPVISKYLGNPEWYHQILRITAKGNKSIYSGNNNQSTNFDSGVDMSFVDHLESLNFILEECAPEFCRFQKDGAILIVTAGTKTGNLEDPTEASFALISSSGYTSVSGKKSFQLSSSALNEIAASYKNIISNDIVAKDWD